MNSLQWSLRILWQWAKSLSLIIVEPLRLNHFNLFIPLRVIQRNLHPMAKITVDLMWNQGWADGLQLIEKMREGHVAPSGPRTARMMRGHVCIMKQRNAESFFCRNTENTLKPGNTGSDTTTAWATGTYWRWITCLLCSRLPWFHYFLDLSLPLSC